MKQFSANFNHLLAYPYVYLLISKLTGEYYFGSRWANWLPAIFDLGFEYFGSPNNKELQKRIKFGEFEFNIIDYFTDADEAYWCEQDLIKDAIKIRKDRNCLNKWCQDPDTKQKIFKYEWTEEQRKKQSKMMLNNNPSKRPEVRKKRSDALKGVPKSNEYKQRIKGEGNPFYGKQHSEDWKKSQSKRVKGLVWIHSLKENKHKMISLKDLEIYLNNGWQKGRIIKNRKPHSEETKKKMCENHADLSGENHPLYGKVLIHSIKEKRQIYIKLEELQNYLNNGWAKGRMWDF